MEETFLLMIQAPEFCGWLEMGMQGESHEDQGSAAPAETS
jgi:hypothetical protein